MELVEALISGHVPVHSELSGRDHYNLSADHSLSVCWPWSRKSEVAGDHYNSSNSISLLHLCLAISSVRSRGIHRNGR